MEKKKPDYRILIIIILIIILGVFIYLYNTNTTPTTQTTEATTTSNSTSTTTTEAQAEKKTIQNTISSSGEIKTGLDEKLTLHATYYFSEIYYEIGDTVSAGENILKYTNGTYLTAPYNLVIASINIPNTNSQCTNSHYIQVNSTDTLSMSLTVAEDNLNKVSVGQEVSIVPTVDTSKTYTGYVISVGNSGTYSSNGSNYSVEVTFDNDGILKVGMSAKADIVLERAENTIVVPKEAVQTSNGNKYVVVVNNGETSQVTVETGISNDAYTEIKSGLEEGQTVQITKTESSTTSNNFRGGMQKNSDSKANGGEIPSGEGSMPSEGGEMPAASGMEKPSDL